MRIHEILGVEPNEHFYVKYMYRDHEVYLDKAGQMRQGGDTGKDYVVISEVLTTAINHGIIRKPRLMDEQIELLKAAQKLHGARWLAKDLRNNAIFLYTGKPSKSGILWLNDSGFSPRLPDDSPLASLVSWDDESPLDIEQTLRDAGAL